MALAEGGDEVHVISYALPSRLSFTNPRIFFHEVVTPTYPLFENYPPYSLALSTKMVEVARHAPLDVLHAHYAIPNAVSAVMARQIVEPQPLPVVTTLHGTDVTLVGNDPNYLETTRWGVVQSDAVTAVSESLRRTTVEQLGVHSEIEVVPNFIDPARFEAARAGPGARRWAKPGERLLVHISNFRPVKRVLDVIGIFQRVQQKVPSRLILVGDGPERGKVEQYCREHRICGVDQLHRQLPAGRGGAGGGGPLPAAVGERVVRPLGARGDGLRGAGGGERRRRPPRGGGRRRDRLPLPVGDVDGMAAAAMKLLDRRRSPPPVRRGVAPPGRRGVQPGRRRAALPRDLRAADRPPLTSETSGALMPAYRAPGAESRAEIRERGSVFLAAIAPAADEAAAKAFLARLQKELPDATHHCWAWRLGAPPRERGADAGEPAGTAGVPILQVLRGAGLSDAMAVVARWFGGIKLGKGGSPAPMPGRSARRSGVAGRRAGADGAGGRRDPLREGRRGQAPAAPARDRAGGGGVRRGGAAGAGRP